MYRIKLESSNMINVMEIRRIRNAPFSLPRVQLPYLLTYGSAAELDTCFLNSYGLARSATCGPVSSLQVSQPK